MKEFRMSFKQFSLASLCIFSSAFAEPTEKIVNVSLGKSELHFNKTVPVVSTVNGTLFEDEPKLNVVLDLATFTNFFTNKVEIEQQGGFYKELRNFRDLKLDF